MRFRFAPSPTGHLHIGNARTALLAWLQARSAGGAFVLRSEDLDAGRVRDEYRLSQLLDLAWMGLDWDEGPDVGGPVGPYQQSLRTELYDDALARLARQGLLYGCVCSRREIQAAASAPHQGEEGPAYPGTCRDRQATSLPASYALRFRILDGEVAFDDLVQGRQRFRPALETGDVVVRRKDGVAAYQLAVVVDDGSMGITHVLRGADLLPSTARQILLYRALGLSTPEWAHVPLMFDAGGERLAKRDAALSLRHLRDRAVPPERLVGWLAFTAGLVPANTEALPTDLVALFEIDRLSSAATLVEIPTWINALGRSR